MEVQSRLKNFFSNMVGSMDNLPGGHSLKKWLAVGMYWLIWWITINYCDKDNCFEFVVAHISTMLALAGVYTWAKLKEDNPTKVTATKETTVVTNETEASV